jgi:hypothetical protein
MTLEDIQQAILKLTSAELASFRAWFDEYEATPFDRRIRRDACARKFDCLAERAIADFPKGHAREL